MNWIRHSLVYVALATSSFAAGPPLAAQPETKTLTLEDGRTAEVEAGWLKVPESRGKDTSRTLSLPYYRIPSTAQRPAAPVFLLAGGPGSSWIRRAEKSENFDELMLYRQFADVVLFDQRGGGEALPALDCPQRRRLPADQPLDRRELSRNLRQMLTECRDHWLAEGVDLAAYNTDANAADLDALRQTLGYERITLVGGSYGSHLALHYMRRYPERVDRAMLYGIEGPDHTWDDPTAALATLERIAAVAEASGRFDDRLPAGGLIAALGEVLERLEQQPARVSLERNDQSFDVVVDRLVVALVADHRAGRRSTPEFWPELILAMHRGDFSLPARAALALRNLRLDDPMHYSMDCASGISAERRRRYQASPAIALLGDLNFEYSTLCDLWPAADLGEQFRTPVRSSAPTLILHGTWDTATPIENAREVAAALDNGHLVEVIGGNHGALYNLYSHWPPMKPLVGRFLRGHEGEFPDSVTLPAVTFPAPEAGSASR
ncbi:MAG: alpha/beta hydrolase [Acidobacteriota bacterium]